jgi:KDO2-lipid IV(A) lauroyltransferase
VSGKKPLKIPHWIQKSIACAFSLLSFCIGRMIGYMVAYCRPALRKRAAENVLSAIYSCEKKVQTIRGYECLGHTPDSLKKKVAIQIADTALSYAGVIACDTLLLWTLPWPIFEPIVTTTGWDDVMKYRAAFPEKGMLFFTPHIGHFEMTAAWLSKRIPFTAMFRSAKNPIINRYMYRGRQHAGANLVAANLHGVRTLLKGLKKGDCIGLLPDQVPQEGEGVWANFFGKPAYTMTLLVKLLASTHALCIYAVAERKPFGGGVCLHFSVLDDGKILGNASNGLDASSILSHRVQQMNDVLEEIIVELPSQYLWGYNRYKVPSGVIAPQ